MATVRELYEKGKAYYDRQDWSNAAYYLKQSANMGHETSAGNATTLASS